MSKNVMRRQLSMPGLLNVVRDRFEKILDPTRSRGLPLSDCLMSGLAVFLLKYPSLLRFDDAARGGDPAEDRNLPTLFGVRRAPSDSAMRERLDRPRPAVAATLLYRGTRPAAARAAGKIATERFDEAEEQVDEAQGRLKKTRAC